MTDFKRTNWANRDFARGYREKADVFIVERRRMLDDPSSRSMRISFRTEPIGPCWTWDAETGS